MIVWALSANGLFTTKSAYESLQGQYMMGNNSGKVFGIGRVYNE